MQALSASQRGIGSLVRGMCPVAAAAVTAINRNATSGPKSGGGHLKIRLHLPSGVGGPPFRVAVRLGTSRARTDGPALMSELARAKGREQVVGVVDRLVGAGVLGRPRAMTTVLQVMGRNKLIKEAVELHRRMADPTVITYTALIKACDNARDLGKALEVFADMTAAGVRPNAVTYTTLIKACDNARDLGKGLEVFAEMKAAGVRPNAVTYTTLIKACDNAGDLGKGLEIRAEMKAAGVRHSDVVVSSPQDWKTIGK